MNKDLRELILELDEDEVKSILLDVVSKYPSIAMKLRQKLVGIDEYEIIENINCTIRKYGFIDWRRTGDFYDEICDVLSPLEEALYRENDIEPYMVVANYLVLTMNEIDIDDSAGTTTDIIMYMIDLLERHAEIHPEGKTKLGRFAYGVVIRESNFNYKFEETMLKFADEDTLESYVSDYDEDELRYHNRTYIAAVEKIIPDPYERIIKFEKYERYTNFAEKLIKLYQEIGDDEKILELCSLYGKNQFFFEAIKEVMRRKNKTKLVELLKIQLCSNDPALRGELDNFIELRDIIGLDLAIDFVNNSDVNDSLKCEIYNICNLDELLIATVINSESEYLFERYKDKVIAKDFGEYLKFYRKYFISRIDGLSNRNEYRYFIADVIKFAKSNLEYKECMMLALGIYKEIKANYSRRPALIDESRALYSFLTKNMKDIK